MKIKYLYFLFFTMLCSCQKNEKSISTHKGMYFSLNDYVDKIVASIDTTSHSIKMVNDEKITFENKKVKKEISELKDADINKKDWQGLYTIDTMPMAHDMNKIIYKCKKNKQRIQSQIVYRSRNTEDVILVLTQFNFSNFLYSLHKNYIITQDKIVLETEQHNILGDDTKLKIEYSDFNKK